MDSNLSALLSGIVSGMVAVLASVSIEKLGGFFGGVISTSPTTIIIASYSIYINSATISQFQTSMYLVAPGILLDVAFLLSWKYLPHFSLIKQMKLKIFRLISIIVLSFAIWIVLSILLIQIEGTFSSNNFALYFAIACMLIQIFIGVFFVFFNGQKEAPKGSNSVSKWMYVARFLGPFFTIGASVLLASYGYSVAAGLSSTFPAIFSASMAGIYWSQGEDCSSGAVGTMCLGSIAVPLFAMLSSILFPLINIYGAATLCYFLSLSIVCLPLAFYYSKRASFTKEVNVDEGVHMIEQTKLGHNLKEEGESGDDIKEESEEDSLISRGAAIFSIDGGSEDDENVVLDL